MDRDSDRDRDREGEGNRPLGGKKGKAVSRV